MADRYWVGGSGTWDATTTTNWSATSGGSGGASAPTSADNVFFNVNSNVGTGAFTVTVSTATCLNFTASGLDGVMTVDSASTNTTLDVYGSMTLPATNLTWSPSLGITLNFRGTTSNTITTNGVSINTTNLVVDGVGGTLTLGSALTLNSTRALTIANGSFSTSGSSYSISTGAIVSSFTTTRSISLNASAVTLTSSTTATSFGAGTNLTFNAGTSTITCNAGSTTFSGGTNGLTFYNVVFSSSGGGTIIVNGANTYNNFTQTSRSATGARTLIFTANQTINGTLTLGATNTSIRRIFVFGTTSTGAGVGTPITLTVATVATLSDVDFRDIIAAGASGTWSGIRLGNCGGNSNITFDAGVNKYWNLAAGGSWQSTAWALTSGGAVAANNFPLAQDTAIIENTGLTAGNTITIDNPWMIGTIDASTRTTAFTLASGTQVPFIFGSVNIPSVATVTGTGSWYFGAVNSTQNITTNGVNFPLGILLNGSTSNIVRLLDNLTGVTNFTLTQGTFDLNNNTLSMSAQFNSNIATVRTLAFGTSGKIVLTGTNANLFTTSTATNLTVTGTNPLLQLTTNATTGARTIVLGSASEANAISVDVTAGSDQISLGTTSGSFKNISATGFTGNINFSNTITIFGNFDVGTCTNLSGTGGVGFFASSSSKTVRTNGLTFPASVTFSGTNGIWTLLDNLNVATALILNAGTLNLDGYTATASIFQSNVSTARAIDFNSTGKIVLTGNNANILSMSTATNFTYTGTSRIECTYSGSTGTRTITPTSVNAVESNVLNIYVTAGTDILQVSGAGRFLNFDLTGFAGTLTTASSTRYFGNLVFSSGMTLGTIASTFTFSKTSGTQTITSAGKTIDTAVTIDGVGGTVSLQDALTLISTQTLTLTNGTLNLNGYTLTTGLFSSSVSTARVLAFGTGNITLTGNNATIWSCTNLTNFSYTGTPTVNCVYSGSTGTRTLTHGSSLTGTEANAVNFNISAGSDTIITTALFFARNLSFVGFSGTLTANNRNVYGNFTLSPTMTLLSSSGVTNFTATSGTKTITTAGLTFDFPVTFDGIGGTWAMQDALTLASTRMLTLNHGTLQSNGYLITTGDFSSTGTGTRTLSLSSGSISLTDTGTVWTTSGTGFSMGANDKILLSTATAQTLSGGGVTFGTLSIENSAAKTITGNNTFNNIVNTVTPTTINFEAASTNSFYNFNLSGTILESSVNGTQFNLYNLTGKDIRTTNSTIKDSAALPNGYWFAPIANGNVNAGNNSGWNFNSAQLFTQLMNFLVS